MKAKPYDFAWEEWPTLPEDADEVLLGLLARDNEPCVKSERRRPLNQAEIEAERVANAEAWFRRMEEQAVARAADERAMRAEWRARSEAARDMRDATTRLGYRPLAARTVPVSIAKGWPGYWSLTFEVPPDASGS